MKLHAILAAVALATASAAQAGTLFTMKNKAGGLIEYTDAPCTTPGVPAGAFVALSTTKDGDTHVGCWTYDTSMEVFRVRWPGAGWHTYADGFDFTKYGREAFPRLRERMPATFAPQY